MERTVAKAVLWQLPGLAVMLGVGVLATGSVALGGTIALANTVVGLMTYGGHEPHWSRISWGRM